jgi:hypothetical protein
VRGWVSYHPPTATKACTAHLVFVHGHGPHGVWGLDQPPLFFPVHDLHPEQIHQGGAYENALLTGPASTALCSAAQMSRISGKRREALEEEVTAFRQAVEPSFQRRYPFPSSGEGACMKLYLMTRAAFGTPEGLRAAYKT